MDKKVIKLLNYLGLDHNTDVEVSEYDNDIFEVDGKEYMVLTDEEADATHYDYIYNLIDDLGISAFTEYAQEYIIENYMDTSWFDECMKESHECYATDIKHESATSDKFENRLEEEMSEASCEDEESFVEYLCSQYHDGVEWYIFNFGEKEFSEAAIKNCSIDIQAVSEFCISEDGRGHSLATYDGHELELEDNYFAYRIG